LDTAGEYAVRELGCGKGAVVMIGDQYQTDVAGANLGGVRSIKLPTLAREPFRPAGRMPQRLETGLYAVLY
jgi:predicted HAD superfamily phosphohydrolase YqeG